MRLFYEAKGKACGFDLPSWEVVVGRDNKGLCVIRLQKGAVNMRKVGKKATKTGRKAAPKAAGTVKKATKKRSY
jgi:hypothetical protein